MQIEVSQTSSYRPKVTKHIQTMIEKYTAKSLLKEFLQNADDAGATQLTVTLDLRNHGCFQLKEFSIASGPALVISNDAPFTDRDFNAIDKIMEGNKIDNAQSTGRFGQGFTSSFSVSDHPSLFSGGMTHGTSKWFDVHESAVCKDLNDAVATWKHDEISNEFYLLLKQWLKTFLLPGEEDTVGRTVFRLPLRTVETAKHSEISSQVFDVQHFYDWCDEWRDHADNLLFLRNVHTLALYVVDEDGNTQDLLKIETKNIEKVSSLKKIISNAFPEGMSPKNVCETWMSNDSELPIAKYEHEFHCQYYDRQTSETVSYDSKWAVVNGLFRGKDNVLLKQALKVLGLGPNFRKVLPWAGVAIPLSKPRSRSGAKGRYFTFLPLDIETGSNVHMHGWFELDDKRTNIVLQEGNDDQALLVEWNLMLTEHAVGKAWAEVLLEHKHTLPVDGYYKFWPSFSRNAGKVEHNLQKGFYERMAKAACLKIWHKDKDYWSAPSEEQFYCSKLERVDAPSIELKKIVQKQLKLIHPEPPRFVVSKLNAFGGNTSDFNPDVLIDAVSSSSKDIDFPLENRFLSNVFFASRESVAHILKYAVQGTKGASGVVGLPLEYCLDGKLYEIQYLSVFSNTHNFEAFKGDKSRFVDKSLYSNLNANEKPDTWLISNLENQLKILSEMMESEPMDLDWFDEVIEMVRRSGEDQRHTERVQKLLASLPIYKAQGAKLASLSSLKSSQEIPYLELKIENRDYYEKLDIRLYDENWVKRYQKLDKLFERKFSPFSIITNETVLAYIANMNASTKQSLETTEFRHFVLHSISITDLSSHNCKSLINDIKNNIPLVLTQNNDLVTIADNERNLYLPGGFTVDESLSHINDLYDLVHSEEVDFFNVFESFDVAKMSFGDYVENVVIKYLSEPNEIETKHRLLNWLCNEMDSVRDNSEVIGALTLANIVPSSKGASLKPSEVYSPDYFDSLPVSLRITFEKLSDFKHKYWNELLELCGAQKAVSILSLSKGAMHISQTKDIDEAFHLIDFVMRNLPGFESLAKKNIAEHQRLADIPWVPCVAGEYVVEGKENSPLQLASANSITIDSQKYKLCPSFNLLAPKIANDYRKEHHDSRDSLHTLLGLKKSTKLELQAKNYSQLIGKPISSTNKRFLEKASVQLYSNWGRYKHQGDESKPNKILISKQWVLVQNVFFHEVPGLPDLHSAEGLLSRLGRDKNDVKDGLEKLGVLNGPSKKFLIDYMTIKLGLGQVLNDNQIYIAKSALALLERDHLGSLIKGSEVPLLTIDNELHNSSNVLIDEGNELGLAIEKNNRLRVCVSEFNEFARNTSAKSIKYNSIKKIKKEKTEFLSNNQVPDEIAIFTRKLKTPWFENAVRRVVFNSSKLSISEFEQQYQDRVVPDKITLCESLTLSCSINLLWLYDTNTQNVFEKNGELYVLLDSHRALCIALTTYVCNAFSLDGLSLDTNSSIAIFTLIRDIHSEEKADDFLENEMGIPKLPDDSKFKLPKDSKEASPQPYIEADLNIEADMDIETDLGIEPEQLESIPVPEKQCKATLNTTYNLGNVANSPREVGNSDDGLTEQIRKLEDHINKNPHQANDNQAVTSGEPKRAPNTTKTQSSINRLEKGTLGDNRLNAPRQSSSESRPSGVENQKLDVAHDGYRSHNRKSGMGTSFTGNQTTLLGDAGEDAVLQAIEETLPTGYEIQKASVNNPGYDLMVLDSNGVTIRKIEVKTLPGGWGDRGVKLSRTQVELALSDSTWSLIVVIGQNTNQASFVDLGNPFNKVKSYFLPSEWNRDFSNGCVEILPFDR